VSLLSGSNIYHARVLTRLRTNKIKIIEREGRRFFRNKEKQHILTDYYRGVLR
jgi:hypothetical protein